MKKFVLAGILAGMWLGGSALSAHAQQAVQACTMVTGANGAQSCSPTLSSKAFPTATGLTNSVVNVKTVPGVLALVHCYNPNSSEIVLQFFNSLAANVVLGTTAPYAIVPIAGSVTGGWSLSPLAVGFNTAISVAATTTSSGSTAPATLPDCDIFFN